MTRCYLGILTALALTFGAIAQEQQSQSAENSDSDSGSSRRSGRSRGGRGDFGGGFEQMRERIRQADAQIKEKFPEEYKELEKLDSSDRRAAYQKRIELARKAGIELPDFGRGRGDRRNGGSSSSETPNNQQEEWQKAEEAIKAKFADEYAEIVKLRETDAAAALVKLRALAEKAGVKLPEGEPAAKEVGVRNIARLAVEQANRILERRYPEEYAEIVKLRETDPDLARDKYRELFKRAGLSSEELKKRIVAHAAGTRIVQVDTSQNNNTGSSNSNSNSNTSRRGNWSRNSSGGGMGGGPGGMGGGPGGGMGGPPDMGNGGGPPGGDL